MNVDRGKITGGRIGMHKDVKIKRLDPCLRNGPKSLLGVSTGEQGWVHIIRP